MALTGPPREQQVLSVLENRLPATDISLLVKYIYTEVDPRLHTVVGHSGKAHLLKREREDRVKRQGEGWTLLENELRTPQQA